MASRLYRKYLTQAYTQVRFRSSPTCTCSRRLRAPVEVKLSPLSLSRPPAPTLGMATLLIGSRDFHPSFSLHGVTPVKMPSLSPTMTEGTIVKWMKAEGDRIAPGDVLCEIQTDKAVVSLEFDDEGILAKILKAENSSEILVGVPIALVVDEGEDWQNVEVPKDVEAGTVAPPSQAPAPSAASHSAPALKGTEVLLGPAVRNLLLQYGLQLAQVPASGVKGNLMKGDVLRLVQQQNLHPLSHSPETGGGPAARSKPAKKESGAPFKDLEITNMRRTIAKRLLQSKSSIPHAYGTTEAGINPIISLRKRMKSVGLKVSVNDFIIKGVGNALAKCPSVNVVLEGTEVVHRGEIDISVAVATESGLITPIVTGVAGKDVLQISESVRQLAEKARSGKLQPQEFMGGTFTISNLGMYGIHHFTAIINPPQCAILAVGGGHTYLDGSGRLETRLSLSLSYDARGISAENAAKFLAHLKHELENPTETSMGIYSIESRIEIQELVAAEA